MPALDHKSAPRPARDAESQVRANEFLRDRTLHRATKFSFSALPVVSNRQFVARVEMAVMHSKQRLGRVSNLHSRDLLRPRRVIFSKCPTAKMEIRESPGRIAFEVRVAPRASRDSVEGEHAGALKILLTAPPSTIAPMNFRAVFSPIV